jgi:hypothetical protein
VPAPPVTNRELAVTSPASAASPRPWKASVKLLAACRNVSWTWMIEVALPGLVGDLDRAGQRLGVRDDRPAPGAHEARRLGARGARHQLPGREELVADAAQRVADGAALDGPAGGVEDLLDPVALVGPRELPHDGGDVRDRVGEVVDDDAAVGVDEDAERVRLGGEVGLGAAGHGRRGAERPEGVEPRAVAAHVLGPERQPREGALLAHAVITLPLHQTRSTSMIWPAAVAACSA